MNRFVLVLTLASCLPEAEDLPAPASSAEHAHAAHAHAEHAHAAEHASVQSLPAAQRERAWPRLRAWLDRDRRLRLPGPPPGGPVDAPAVLRLYLEYEDGGFPAG